MLRALVLITCLAVTGCQRNVLHFDAKARPVFGEAAHVERVSLASTENGNILAMGVDSAKKQFVLVMSHDGGDQFMPPIPVSPDGAEIQYRGENGPSLVARGMQVYALWQQARKEGGSDIVVATQRGMGGPFAAPVRVLDKPATDFSFNGFSSMALGPKGELYVVWLDGRAPGQPGTFSVYLAKSNDQGRSFGSNVRVQAGACPCCRPSIAVDDDGTVYVAWRKVFPGDIRDIVVASSTDAGATFSDPVKAGEDNWVLHACPESGPSMQVKSGRVAVAWFSEGNQQSGIRYAVSTDNGKSFSALQVASNGVEDANHPALAMDTAGDAVLAFQGRATRADQQWGPFSTFAVRATHNGRLSAPEAVPGGEGSSYPVAISPGLKKMAIAWTRGHGQDANIMFVRTRIGSQE